MDWRIEILEKLNLSTYSKKLIIDNSKILQTNYFLEFISSKNIELELMNNESAFLNSGSNFKNNVITGIKSIPAFVKSKYDVIKFELSDLPKKIDIQLLQSLNTFEIIELLDYLNNQALSNVITIKDYEKVKIGISKQKIRIRIEYLRNSISELLEKNSTNDVVLTLGNLWGELVYLSCKSNDKEYKILQNLIDVFISNYCLSGKHKEIFYAMPVHLKSVHQILPYIEKKTNGKVALLCFDAMGVSEWYLLKEYLEDLKLNFVEKTSFALIPTITALSRASIYYASNLDVYQLSSVNESKALANYFKDKETHYFSEKTEISEDSLLGVDVLSKIYNFFDDISHSTKFPSNYDEKEIYFETARNYLLKSTVKSEIQLLLKSGYQLFFCSDHGSTIARGNGKKIDKWLQDKFSKRGCVIHKTSLDVFSENLKYDIPFVEGKVALLAKNREMFDIKDRIGISHGGITIDELVTPFIEIVK